MEKGNLFYLSIYDIHTYIYNIKSISIVPPPPNIYIENTINYSLILNNNYNRKKNEKLITILVFNSIYLLKNKNKRIQYHTIINQNMFALLK